MKKDEREYFKETLNCLDSEKLDIDYAKKLVDECCKTSEENIICYSCGSINNIDNYKKGKPGNPDCYFLDYKCQKCNTEICIFCGGKADYEYETFTQEELDDIMDYHCYTKCEKCGISSCGQCE